MKGFRDFVFRGNLIELAVAFIMGAAFNSVVTSFTNIVLSLISLVLGGPPNFDEFMPGGVPVGPFLTQLIGFLLVATIVYFGLVLPFNTVRERLVTEAEPAVTETELLTEIRDLLSEDAKQRQPLGDCAVGFSPHCRDGAGDQPATPCHER
ncbi:MAG: MscL family protein [Brooklawnia sp.]|nr:MscL family protein [Brooklawnia sp.]